VIELPINNSIQANYSFDDLVRVDNKNHQQDTIHYSITSQVTIQMHQTEEQILKDDIKHHRTIMKKPNSEHEEEKNEHDDKRFREAVLGCKLAAGHASFQQMKRFAEKSRLERFDDEVHNVSWPEIIKKDVLGEGAFSVVYKVQVASNELSLDSHKHYALKHIKPDITEDSKDFRVAAIDLAVEGELLSRLRHDNIIKLYGIYGGNPKTSYVDFKDGYFLLIDVLEDTLTRRLLKMRRIAKKKKRNGNYTMLNMVQKVAIGIAKGLQYLHENGVILRDLKPDNVGFDENGTPVIFDLGFARELHTVHKSEVAGSLRYMSPEIGLSQGATLASDVYSFGVLLYELCTLEKPFKQYKGRPEFIQDVFINNYRPDLTGIISKAIRDLISRCWDKDQSKRPNMKTAGNILRVETALLNVRHQVRKKSSTPTSTIRRSEQSIPSSISSSTSSNVSTPSLSLTSASSMSSFRPSPKTSSRRLHGHSNPMGMRSTIHSSVDINSYAKRSSSMRRMSSENFVWNSDVQGHDGSPSSTMNKQFGKTLRGRNSLTSSLFDRRKRNSSSRSLLKESLSTDSFGGLNNIEEMKASNHGALPIHSSRSRHRGLGSALSRLSSDSMSSFVSFSGDSVATDMSASNFTLGELKPRKLGMSKRNAFFPSLSSRNLSSSKALFTIDIEGTSEFAEQDKDMRNAVFNNGCIENEDLSSDSSEELGMREPKQVELLTT